MASRDLLHIHFNTDYEKVVKNFSVKNRRRFVWGLQLGLAQFLAVSRLHSITKINPRTRRTRILGRLYKEQPSTPGQLTERTGAMLAGLKEGGRVRDQESNWAGFGKRSVNTLPSRYPTLHGRIRATEKGVHTHYKGTLSPFVRDTSKALATKPRKAQKQTKVQIAMRYNWERGLSGKAPRPYIGPAAIEMSPMLKKYVESQMRLALRVINGKA